MPKVIFKGIHQRSQNLGTDNEHMVSILTVKFNKKDYECEIRQDAGESHSFEETAFNISPPEDFKGKIQYEAFREAAEEYFRTHAAGSRASGIRVEGDSSNITMRGNTFITPEIVVDLPAPGKSSGGW